MEATTQKAQVISIINRLKLVILSPKECWNTIAAENESPASILSRTIIPIVVVGAICTIIGLQVFGIWLGGLGTWRPPVIPLTLSVLVMSIFQILFVYIGAFLVQKLAPLFQGQTSPSQAFSLVSHAAIPGFFVSILRIYPPLGFLGIVFGIIGIYALFQGISKMTTISEDKRLAFAASFVVSMMLVGLVLLAVSGMFALQPIPGNLG